MSGSGDDSVKVTISAEITPYQKAMDRGYESSKRFQEALAAVGGDFRKLTPEMLTTAKAADTFTAGIVGATATIKAAQVSLVDMVAGFAGVDRASKDAAESAAFFIKALNPTLVKQMRDLMSEVVPPTHQFGVELETASRGSLQFNQGVKSAADSAMVFEQALAGNKTPLQQLKTLMADEIPAASHKVAGGFSGITREVVVLGREAMVGNFSRIPGSLMALAERSNGLISKIAEIATAMSATAVSIAVSVVAIVASIGAITARAIEAANAIRRVGNAAVLLGENTKAAKEEADKLTQRLQAIGVGQTEAIKVVSAMHMITASSKEQRAALTDLATGFALSLGIEPAKAAEQLARALEKGGGGVRKLIDEYKLWDAQSGLSQRMQLKLAEDTHDSAAEIDIAIAVLSARFPEYTAKIKAFRTAGSDQEFQAGPAGAMALPDAPQRSEDPNTARQRDATAQHATQLEHLQALQKDLAAAQATYSAAATEGERAIAEEAVKALTVEIRLHRERGDASWLQEQTAAVNAMVAKTAEAATDSKSIAADENRTRIAFWDEQLSHTNLTESQRTIAESHASIARRNLAAEELRLKAEGEASWKNLQLANLNAILAGIEDNATQSKTLAQDENKAKIAFWHAAAQQAGLSEKQITEAQAEEARARHALTTEELHAREADEASWHAVHQESLNVTLAQLEASGRGSKQLAMDENRARVSFWTAAAKEIGVSEKNATAARAEAENANRALTMETLRGGESAAKQALATRMAALSAEQAAVHDNFTAVMAIEAQKIALLRASGVESGKLLQEELAKEQNLLRQHAAQVAADRQRDDAAKRNEDSQEIAQNKATLDEQVAEGRLTKIQAIELERSFAAEKHAIELTALEATLKTLGDETEARRKQMRDISQLKQQWATEDAKLNRAALLDFKAQWDKMTAPVEGAMTQQLSAVLRGNATMGQAVRGFAASVVLSYVDMAAKKVFTEVSSQAMATAAHALGFSQRAAIGQAETAAGNSDLIVRLGRWVATQLGLTAATGAGATARAGVLTAEQLAAVTATGVTARLSIAAAASVAAAWAFADSAALGPPGLVAAPGVSAGAFAEVMAFQATVPALATGAWNIPQDMGANLHAGEMVIPASFAEGIRGAGNGGGGQTLNYQPTIHGGGADPASMRSQAGMIKSYLWHATRNGALRLPGR